MKSMNSMNTVLKKNQYYVVSGLKRYREIVKKEMLLARRDMRSSSYVVARQKKKIYETLISMVIHESVDDTIEFALRLYARLPNKPIKAKTTVKACEQALESFFLLSNVSPHIQQLHKQQRPIVMHDSQNDVTIEGGTIDKSTIDKSIIDKSTIENGSEHNVTQLVEYGTAELNSAGSSELVKNEVPPNNYTETLTESYREWGNPS